MTRTASRLGALFLAAALAGVAWRPAILGFLTDDWTVLVEPTVWSAPFSAERWESLVIAQNRPVLRVIFHVLTSLVPADPVAWHVVGALLNVAAGLAVGVCVHDLLRAAAQPAEDSRIGGAFAGACWIVFPFSAATQFWATGTTAMPAVIAFALSTSLLVRAWDGPTGTLWLGAVVSLLGYLTYESFYFQFALVIAYLAWMRGWSARGAWTATIAYGGAQIAAVVFSRAMRMMGAEGSRGVNAGFIDTFFHWYLYVGRAVGLGRGLVYLALVLGAVALGGALWVVARRRGRALPPVLALALGVAIVATGAVVITLPLSLGEGLALVVPGLLLAALIIRRGRVASPSAVPALLVLAGIALGALPFALGNYVVFALGFGARATLASSVWIALGLGLVAARAWQVERSRRGSLAALALIWLGLLGADVLRGLEWARAGRLLARVFVDPPRLPFEAVPADAQFVMITAELPGWVPVVEVNHHVAAIARLAFRAQAGTPARLAALRDWERRWVVSRTLVWDTSWDGARLVQRECRGNALIADVPATSLWVWDQTQGRIGPVAAPYRNGCRASG